MNHIVKRSAALIAQAVALLLLVSLTLHQPIAIASPSIPPTWPIVGDDFESGTLDAWEKVSAGDLGLLPDGGHNGSTGLSVAVGQQSSYLFRRDFAPVEEGYLTFWFNPNGVSIPDQGTSWIPSKSIRIADVKGSQWWHLLVGLRLRKPTGEGYKAYLEWSAPDGNHYDLGAGEFSIVDGWQKITLGFHVDEWVAVWVNDVQVREITGIDHEEALGDIIETGKASNNSVMTPSGQMRFDDIAFEIPRIGDLWVDAATRQRRQRWADRQHGFPHHPESRRRGWARHESTYPARCVPRDGVAGQEWQ